MAVLPTSGRLARVCTGVPLKVMVVMRFGSEVKMFQLKCREKFKNIR